MLLPWTYGIRTKDQDWAVSPAPTQLTGISYGLHADSRSKQIKIKIPDSSSRQNKEKFLSEILESSYKSAFD